MKNKKMIKIEVLIGENLNQVISDDMEITGRNRSEIIRSFLIKIYRNKLTELSKKIN